MASARSDEYFCTAMRNTMEQCVCGILALRFIDVGTTFYSIFRWLVIGASDLATGSTIGWMKRDNFGATRDGERNENQSLHAEDSLLGKKLSSSFARRLTPFHDLWQIATLRYTSHAGIVSPSSHDFMKHPYYEALWV